ncbi:hypothetical protein DSO57_1036505 [Entomophthora muscae]|uniref:Uncharacterized protein n=1 Tax=Entomophthora muscae TaxID=34485 RepID=A0ACC2U8R4_9FUNG|nr:hypothetical protein DSO57_1036505 [Entomophthora muscae]
MPDLSSTRTVDSPHEGSTEPSREEGAAPYPRPTRGTHDLGKHIVGAPSHMSIS